MSPSLGTPQPVKGRRRQRRPRFLTGLPVRTSRRARSGLLAQLIVCQLGHISVTPPSRMRHDTGWYRCPVGTTTSMLVPLLENPATLISQHAEGVVAESRTVRIARKNQRGSAGPGKKRHPRSLTMSCIRPPPPAAMRYRYRLSHPVSEHHPPSRPSFSSASVPGNGRY